MDDPEVHAGYEFEEGMFARVRCWVDLFPWVRLTRIPRLLASPAYVITVAIAWAMTSFTFLLVYEQPIVDETAFSVEAPATRIWRAIRGADGAANAIYVLFLIGLWSPVIQIVARGGAGLATGGGLPGFLASCGVVRSRLLQSYAVPFAPWLGAAALALVVWVLRVPGFLGWPPLSWLVGLGVGCLAIPLGILCFGALFAVPLALAAMVCEPDPDPIDSLSRGYEALFRRPLHFVFYLLFSLVLCSVAAVLLGGVCSAAWLASQAILSIVVPDPIQLRAAAVMIETVYWGWLFTLLFGLLGGTYLLLRFDAGGQEVEDFWHPPQQPPMDLPELPEQAYRS